MTALTRTSSNCKRQTHQTITAKRVQLKKKYWSWVSEYSGTRSSKTNSKEEHNAPTPTQGRIEVTCIYIYTHILTTETGSFLIKKILAPDDGHIGRNM
jgi:hypothetical protein